MNAEATSICVLDDDASVLQSIARLLDSDGWVARTFEKATDLLNHVRQYQSRLVVLDVWMPETGGLEVQARLRELAPETRVIFMTARDDAAIRTAALRAGATAFFAKPFDDDHFLNAIRNVMEAAV